MRTLSAFLIVSSATCFQAATAGTITSYDRATFQAALSSTSLFQQDFDSLATGTITTVNGVTYSASQGTALVTNLYLTTTEPNGLGSTSIGYFLPTETLTITFATPVTAFALDINTFATEPGSYQVAVNDGTNSVIPALYDVFPNQSTGEFVGFVDTTPFDTVVLSAPGLLSYTVDTLVYGDSAPVISQAIPEPSEWALFGLGLPVLAAVIRRRRK